jgi:murein hydrolase activator
MSLRACPLQFLKNISPSGKPLFLLFVSLFIWTNLSAQKKNELENKRKNIQNEIKITESLLKETKENKKLSLNQLVALNQKISMREELIRTINAQIKSLENKISESQGVIEALENDLITLKSEYAQMIVFANKNKNAYDRLMFLFASKDFNQAYKRLKYLQQYSEYRKKQAELIVKTKDLLSRKIKDFEVVKLQKLSLLTAEEQEKNLLAEEKKEQEETLNVLKNKEKELMVALKEKEKEQKQLQLAIQRVIENEIKRNKEVAAKAGKPAPVSVSSTPEALALSSTFESNKTKLPWPVNEGIITGKFGEHAHPVIKGITIKNNGVDITTSKGSAVRAVFDGEVTGVVTMPGYGKVVIIRHGEYLSVYSNLKDASVKMGDKVTTKQIIGSVITDELNSKTEVHFEIYKGQTALNPEYWLFRSGN